MIWGVDLGLIRSRVVPRLTASLVFLETLFVCADGEQSGNTHDRSATKDVSSLTGIWVKGENTHDRSAAKDVSSLTGIWVKDGNTYDRSAAKRETAWMEDLNIKYIDPTGGRKDEELQSLQKRLLYAAGTVNKLGK